MHTTFWKRLGLEGHDACRFAETDDGWAIEGTAVFDHNGDAAALTYKLLCDKQWRSRRASVSGWVGANDIELLIEQAGHGGWSVNGRNDDALSGLEDIDLGFTPASNTNAIRRLNLSEGEAAESEAVWLDTDDWSVKPLRQSYRRVGGNAYDYESPMHDYRATLLVDDFGVVQDYPGLWVMLETE
jgi:hypothetical protein